MFGLLGMLLCWSEERHCHPTVLHVSELLLKEDVESKHSTYNDDDDSNDDDERRPRLVIINDVLSCDCYIVKDPLYSASRVPPRSAMIVGREQSLQN